MARTKNTARGGVAKRLPRASFKRHRTPVLKLKTNAVPSDGEDSPLQIDDWSTLEPTLPGGSSPEVEAAVERANAACPLPTPPPEGDQEATIGAILDELTASAEPRTPSPLPILRSPPRSPFEDGVLEDLPVVPNPTARPPPPLEPTVITETTQATARSVQVVPSKTLARPNRPTIAKKCPRAEFSRDKAPSEVAPLEKKRKTLSALQEIRHLQTTYRPVLPLAPFTRLVRNILFGFGQYRITSEALDALRQATEQYAVVTLEGANLLTRHRDRCTLQPKDIRMARRVRGEDVSIGITQEAAKAEKEEWRQFQEQRVSLHKAIKMETLRRQKLRKRAHRRMEIQRRALQH